MSKQQESRPEPSESGAGQASPFESGIVPRETADQMEPERAPPWAVMKAYLSTGEHHAWVEGWAARSPAFADVLAALRHDQDERASARAPAGSSRGAAARRRR